jgi:hypothetical protein
LRACDWSNTEEGEKLYVAPIAGKARQVMHVYRYGVDDPTPTRRVAGSKVWSAPETASQSAPGDPTARLLETSSSA